MTEVWEKRKGET